MNIIDFASAVILGGDTPLALPLILDLEANGYIVIASVASPEAAEALERQCHGYVKALVLDPYQVQRFLRDRTMRLLIHVTARFRLPPFQYFCDH